MPSPEVTKKYRSSEKGRATTRAYDRSYYHRVLKFKPGFSDWKRKANERGRLKSCYGLTPEQVREMKSRGCALCGVRDGKLNIDHDHETNVIRGVLCNPCDLMLGYIERARSMNGIDEYLQRGKVRDAIR